MRSVGVLIFLAFGLSVNAQEKCPPQEALSERPRPCLWKNWSQKKEKGFRFLNWLIAGCNVTDEYCPKSLPDRHVEYEGYDGWYNNIAVPSLGAVDTPLQRLLPSAYSDGVYQPAKRKVNPLLASQRLMSGKNGLYSKAGRTAFSVYFGQQVVEEILDSQGRECPPEYFNIDIYSNHSYRKEPPYLEQLPFHRTRYDKTTGSSPNNPRQQLNEITPYFDGGLIYGTSKGIADVLRFDAYGKLAPHGKLASYSKSQDLPAENAQALPMANPPPPTNHNQYVEQGYTAPVDRFFKLGNPRGNENPFLLTFGILWFRWHNLLAGYFKEYARDWKDERIFNEARKWVIATYQSVVLYDWLPKYMRAEPGPYKGYNPSINPQVSHVFQSAAMRFGHTLVTSGGYLRDRNKVDCDPVAPFRLSVSEDTHKITGVRTCNSFWRSPEFFLKDPNTFDRFLMGLSSQSSEEEDNIIVDDLRGNVFGPLEFSRRDLMALNIQRGRDHGLPDYNTARKYFGLPTLESLRVDEYKTVTNTEVKDEVLEELQSLYEDPSKLDIWPGGLLETTKGPGQLFSKIIFDQFERSRDGDRFWIENKENDLFTAEERYRIRRIRIIDIIQAVTELVSGEDIQEDPFTAVHSDNNIGENCQKQLTVERNCTLPDNRTTTCYYLPQLRDDNTEKCTRIETYDYFSGSEVSYLLSFIFIGLSCIGLLVFVTTMARDKKIGEKQKEEERGENDGSTHKARERVSHLENRDVIIQFVPHKKRIEVYNMEWSLLRMIDFNNVKDRRVIIKHLRDFSYVVLQVVNHYDLFLKFREEFYGENYKIALNKFFEQIGIYTDYRLESITSIRLHLTTVYDREKKLEEFSREVFSKALKHSTSGGIPKSNISTLYPDTSVKFIEITEMELAQQLGLLPNNDFVKQMFKVMDKDEDGFITIREFWDVIFVLAKGSESEKAELLFKICDVSGNGTINANDFTNIVKGTTEGGHVNVNEMTRKILNAIGIRDGESVSLEQFKKFFALRNSDIKSSGLDKGRHASRRYSSETQPLLVTCGYSDSVTVEDEKQSGFLIAPIAEWFDGVSNQLRSREQYYFWKSLYTIVMIYIFTERGYYFLIEQEHNGLRRVTSVGVSFTRGAASAMMFTYSTLLVTMCRNIFSKLRSTPLHRFFPFDDMVSFHQYVGTWALIWTLIHVIGHAINFYHISTQTPMDLACFFRDYFRRSHILPKFHYWLWETITGLTGVFLTVQTAVIYAFAYKLRRHYFKWFWKTHNTYPLYYFLILLHGSGRLVQEPFMAFFFIGPCLIFGMDKVISLSRSKSKIDVLSADHLPSNVVLLKIRRPANFSFKSGQWVRIASLGISEYEYHPFTLSSAPHEEDLTVHIRAVGPWTHQLKTVYPENSQMEGNKYHQIYLDGPYGGSHQMWLNFEVVIFIAGGIGVTPFASILKDINYKLENSKSLLKTKKIFFLWITPSQKQFEWMTEIVKNIEEVDENNMINTQIFITQFKSKYDLRTMVLYLAENHSRRLSGKSLFTGLKAKTYFGRPDFERVFLKIKEKCDVKVISVFTCGASSLSDTVEQTCRKLNRKKSCTCFKHYCENF